MAGKKNAIPDALDAAYANPEAYMVPPMGTGEGDMIASALRSLLTLPKRAIEGAAAYQPGSGTIPNETIGPALESALLPMGTGAIAGVPVRGAEAVLGAGPIRAYHGSPHDFERFDSSKIGTGEGAQSYGHGMYFAENPTVAQSYKEKLAKDPTKPGKMYEAEIDADPARFLEWEKRLDQQAPEVQDAVKRSMGIDYHGNFDPKKAERLWNEHKYSDAGTAVRKGHIAFSDEQVASRLNEAGIPGIKYLDEGSRNIPAMKQRVEALRREIALGEKTEGNPTLAKLNEQARQELVQAEADLAKAKPTSNYVVFDDSLINIVKKYGLAGISMLPPSAAAFLSQRLSPVDHNPFARGGNPAMTPVDHDPFEQKT